VLGADVPVSALAGEALGVDDRSPRPRGEALEPRTLAAGRGGLEVTAAASSSGR
jgi:hypothetical protein